MAIILDKFINRSALEEMKNVTTILKYLDFVQRCKLRLLSRHWDRAIDLAATWHTVDLRWVNGNSKYLSLVKKHHNSVKSLKLSLDCTNSEGYNVIEFDYNGILLTYRNLKHLEVSTLKNDIVVSFVNPSVRYYIDVIPPNAPLLSSLILDTNVTVKQLFQLKIYKLDFLVLTRIISTNVDDISLLSEFIASLHGLQVFHFSFISSLDSINTCSVNQLDSVYSTDVNYNSLRRIERIKALTGGDDFSPGDELIQALLDSHASSLICFYVSIIAFIIFYEKIFQKLHYCI